MVCINVLNLTWGSSFPLFEQATTIPVTIKKLNNFAKLYMEALLSFVMFRMRDSIGTSAHALEAIFAPSGR